MLITKVGGDALMRALNDLLPILNPHGVIQVWLEVSVGFRSWPKGFSFRFSNTNSNLIWYV